MDEPTAATPLRARLDADHGEIEHLTIRMADDVRAPYFADINACIAEYEALLDVAEAVRVYIAEPTRENEHLLAVANVNYQLGEHG